MNERISEHKADLPLECDIYYFECSSEADMNIMELFLIDKYRPFYNKDCNGEHEKTSMTFVEPDWIPLAVYYAPLKVFKGFKRQNGIKKVFLNMRTGKETYESIHYCDCDVDFPQIIKENDYQYTVCTECGKIVRNSFKFNKQKEIYL